jgi:hypothetical protein
VIACRMWFRRTPLVPGDWVPRWCGHVGGYSERRASVPNTPMQPTASRARSLAFWQSLRCARCG